MNKTMTMEDLDSFLSDCDSHSLNLDYDFDAEYTPKRTKKQKGDRRPAQLFFGGSEGLSGALNHRSSYDQEWN